MQSNLIGFLDVVMLTSLGAATSGLLWFIL
jgi:hypothetical protein